MRDSTNNRKLEHIRIIGEDHDVDRRKLYFDDVLLCHRALPELDLKSIDPSISLLGKKLSFPLLISSMTGGDDDAVRTINRNLAIAAELCGVAMGVGSQRVMFTNPGAAASFKLRHYAPTALLFANLGGVQLNYGFGAGEARTAIETVGADGLFLHLNPLQEAVQPEGNTNFSGLADKIGELARSLETPIVIKEIGAGLSVPDVVLLFDHGIRHFDVAGSGGTSWSRIEHHRASDKDSLGLVFQDWGIPTPMALRNLASLHDRVTLFASGGIRNGLDMAKAMVLGASLCGLAKPFLEPAMHSPEKVVEVIETLRREFITAMFLTGSRTCADLLGNQSLLL